MHDESSWPTSDASDSNRRVAFVVMVVLSETTGPRAETRGHFPRWNTAPKGPVCLYFIIIAQLL